MASIGNDPNGRKRILFFDAHGVRRTMRIGRVTESEAKSIKTHVEHIIACQIAGSAPKVSTSLWLADLDDTMKKRLAKFGLAVWQERKAETLGTFLDGYIAERSDVKRSTATVFGHTRRCLVEYFGADKPLAQITAADASKWRRWLTTHEFPRRHGRKGGRLADSTIRRRCSIARQFFNEAVDDRLITENPFRKLKGIGVTANRSRDYFLSLDDATKIIDACPDSEWRLLFALSRYGGFRCPSEHLALTWGDVDWVGGRINVRSPKTEHHGEKHAAREIPIFHELRPYLEDAFILAGEHVLDPSAPVIRRYRGTNVNLRTQLNRIIKRAGLTPWPKLFQNLRATRETELAKVHPIHVVCAWIGNSQVIANKHYLQVTDEDFAVAQKVAQTAAVRPVTEGNLAEANSENPEEFAESGEIEQWEMGGTRLELVTSTV